MPMWVHAVRSPCDGFRIQIMHPPVTTDRRAQKASTSQLPRTYLGSDRVPREGHEASEAASVLTAREVHGACEAAAASEANAASFLPLHIGSCSRQVRLLGQRTPRRSRRCCAFLGSQQAQLLVGYTGGQNAAAPCCVSHLPTLQDANYALLLALPGMLLLCAPHGRSEHRIPNPLRRVRSSAMSLMCPLRRSSTSTQSDDGPLLGGTAQGTTWRKATDGRRPHSSHECVSGEWSQ